MYIITSLNYFCIFNCADYIDFPQLKYSEIFCVDLWIQIQLNAISFPDDMRGKYLSMAL